MKKHLRGFVVLVVVLGLVFSLVVSCAKPAPPASAPSPAPSPAPAPKPKPTATKVIEWDWFIGGETSWDATDGVPQIAKDIEAVTNGRLVIHWFLPGQHGFKRGDFLKAVRDRDTEVVGAAGTHVSGVEPRLSVLEMPMLIATPDFELFRDIYRMLRQSYFKNVWAESNAQELISALWGGTQIFTTKKAGWIENYDSMRGKKLRTFGPESANLAKLLNAIPVSLEFGETYHAMATGLCDGAATSVTAAVEAGWPEVAPNFNMLYMQFNTVPYLVNKDAWAELPADLKDIITEYVKSKRDWFETGHFKADAATLQQAIIKYNVEARPFPPAFREDLRSKSYQAIWKPWLERAGPQGVTAFNEVVKILVDKGFKVPGYTPR